MRAYLIIDNGTAALLKPYKERYRVIVDPVKALRVAKEMGYGQQPMGISPESAKELEESKIGMMHLEAGGDVNVSIMAIEVEHDPEFQITATSKMPKGQGKVFVGGVCIGTFTNVEWIQRKDVEPEPYEPINPFGCMPNCT